MKAGLAMSVSVVSIACLIALLIFAASGDSVAQISPTTQVVQPAPKWTCTKPRPGGCDQEGWQ